MSMYYKTEEFNKLPEEDQIKSLRSSLDFMVKLAKASLVAVFLLGIFGNPLNTAFTNLFQNYDYVYVSKVELVDILNSLNSFKEAGGGVRLSRVPPDKQKGTFSATDQVYTFCLKKELVSKDVLDKIDEETFCPEYPKGSIGEFRRENQFYFLGLSRWDMLKDYFSLLGYGIKLKLGLVE